MATTSGETSVIRLASAMAYDRAMRSISAVAKASPRRAASPNIAQVSEETSPRHIVISSDPAGDIARRPQTPFDGPAGTEVFELVFAARRLGGPVGHVGVAQVGAAHAQAVVGHAIEETARRRCRCRCWNRRSAAHRRPSRGTTPHSRRPPCRWPRPRAGGRSARTNPAGESPASRAPARKCESARCGFRARRRSPLRSPGPFPRTPPPAPPAAGSVCSSQSRTSVAPLGRGTFSETVHSNSPPASASAICCFVAPISTPRYKSFGAVMGAILSSRGRIPWRRATTARCGSRRPRPC